MAGPQTCGNWSLSHGLGGGICAPNFKYLDGDIKSVTGMNLVGRYVPDPSQVTGSLLNVAMQPLGQLGAQSYGVAIGYLPCGTEG